MRLLGTILLSRRKCGYRHRYPIIIGISLPNTKVIGDIYEREGGGLSGGLGNMYYRILVDNSKRNENNISWSISPFYLLALRFHLSNGVRHYWWDLGYIFQNHPKCILLELLCHSVQLVF